MDGHEESRLNPALRRLQAGTASDYIHHAAEAMRPGDIVFLVCRVSHFTQDHTGNLDNQENNLRQQAAELGAVVVGVERYIGPGWNPYWMEWVVAKARRLGATILFAETTDRFIRHPAYHSIKRPDAQARNTDLESLKLATEGMTLMTDLQPDSTPSEVKSYQSKRGQLQKGNPGGRPRKHPRGPYQERATIDAIERIVPLVDRYSVRQIAQFIGRPVSTTQGLIKKARALKSLV